MKSKACMVLNELQQQREITELRAENVSLRSALQAQTATLAARLEAGAEHPAPLAQR